jgi:hypothetical protein
MRTVSSVLGLGALAVLVSAALLVPLAVSHAQGAPPASAAPAASLAAPSASASTVGGETTLPRFADELPPPEKSPRPKPVEWKKATPFRLDHPLRRECTAVRLREWVRVSCEGIGAAVGLVAGPSEGLAVDMEPENPIKTHRFEFPVRRGERRLLQVTGTSVAGYDDSLWADRPWFLSSQWIEGEAPTLTAQNP